MGGVKSRHYGPSFGFGSRDSLTEGEVRRTTTVGTDDRNSCDRLYKVVVIGDKRTGKTCLSSRFKGGAFCTSYLYTIAVEFSIHYVCLNDDWIKVQIWDMSGDSQHWPVSERTCFQSAHGVIIAYDVTDERTFENVDNWVKKTEKHRNSSSALLKVFLLGNKCDRTEEKEVEYSTARKYADAIGAPFMEVSAKDSSNVELAFVTLLAEIMCAQREYM